MNPSNPLDRSRRSFLRLGAGTALAASFSGLVPAWAADDNADASADASAAADKKKSVAAPRTGEYGGLPMGVQSYTLRSLSFEKALDTIANDLKLKYVEIFPGHHPGVAPSQVKEKLQARGLRASAYGVVPFKKDIAANRKFFEIGRALGLKSLSCDPDPDSFDSLDKLVEEYQIAAAIHPHG